MIMNNLKVFMMMILIFTGAGKYCAGQDDKGNTDYQYALIEAVKQKNLGNLPEAVKLYRLVIKDKPDCDVAYYELGSIYLVTNQLELARERLQRAYELSEDNRWYTVAYLNALGAMEEYKAVANILKKKIKEDPDEVEWEFQLANVTFSLGKPRKAVRILEDIEKRRGFSEKITLLKASIYEDQEKYKLAKQEIEKVMVLFPEAVQFRIVAAELCMKSGQEDEAADYYLEVFGMDSTNIYALTNLTDHYRKKEDYKSSFTYLTHSFRTNMIDIKRKMTILYHYLSEEEFVMGYSKELEKVIRVFMQTHPEEEEVKLLAVDFYIETRAYDKAYELMKGFIEKNKGNYSLYMQAILLANAAGKNDELIRVTDLAIMEFPDSADIYFFRGIGLYEQKNYSGLIDNLEEISFENFSNDEYTAQAKLLYAEAYYRVGDYSTSDSLFEKLIAEDPENYVVLNNYSYYLAERDTKLQEARKWSLKATTDNPENATFLDTYAWVLYKLKEYEEAEKYIMIALEKGGKNDPEVNEHAGDIQQALNSLTIAREYYQKAILLGGDRQKLERKISDLSAISNE